jgi:hypothetical protein
MTTVVRWRNFLVWEKMCAASCGCMRQLFAIHKLRIRMFRLRVVTLPSLAFSLPLLSHLSSPSYPLMETGTKTPSHSPTSAPAKPIQSTPNNSLNSQLDEWEKQKQSCPVCKVPFHSIYPLILFHLGLHLLTMPRRIQNPGNVYGSCQC